MIRWERARRKFAKREVRGFSMPEMTERRVAAALLILRISLGIFLLQWGVEKFVIPEAAIRIGQNFYGVALSGIIVVILGAAETGSQRHQSIIPAA